MNAYELADYIQQNYATNGNDIEQLASMLRQQADRIAELEKQNQTLKVGIGLLKGISKMAEDYEKRTTPQIKPLSDEELHEIFRKYFPRTIFSNGFKQFARDAIEKAHDIE